MVYLSILIMKSIAIFCSNLNSRVILGIMYLNILPQRDVFCSPKQYFYFFGSWIRTKRFESVRAQGEIFCAAYLGLMIVWKTSPELIMVGSELFAALHEAESVGLSPVENLLFCRRYVQHNRGG